MPQQALLAYASAYSSIFSDAWTESIKLPKNCVVLDVLGDVDNLFYISGDYDEIVSGRRVISDIGGANTQLREFHIHKKIKGKTLESRFSTLSSGEGSKISSFLAMAFIRVNGMPEGIINSVREKRAYVKMGMLHPDRPDDHARMWIDSITAKLKLINFSFYRGTGNGLGSYLFIANYASVSQLAHVLRSLHKVFRHRLKTSTYVVLPSESSSQNE